MQENLGTHYAQGTMRQVTWDRSISMSMKSELNEYVI